MNAVAMNFVATMVNQNQNAKTSKQSQSAFGHIFNNTYQDYNQSQSNSNDSVKRDQNNHSTPEPLEKGRYTESNKDIKDIKDVVPNERTKALKEFKEQLTKETSKRSEIETDNISKDASADETLSELVNQIAEILGISVSELESILKEMDLQPVDLLNTDELKNVMLDVLNLTDDGQLLQNDEAYKMFKALKLVTSKVDGKDLKRKLLLDDLEKYSNSKREKFIDTEYDNRVDQRTFQAANNNNKNENQEKHQTNPINISKEESTADVNGKLEVVDTRDENFIGKQTSDHSQKDNQQSFSNLMSNAINDKTNDVVIKANGDVVYREINANEILNQVVTKIRVELGNKNTTMSIQLTPENLGKVAFTVSSNNGTLTGNIVAENTTVKEILETNIAHLRANLEEQGVKVDDIKVVVGNSNQFFEKNDKEQQFKGFKGKKSKKISRVRNAEETQDLLEEDDVQRKAIDSLTLDDHSVEYKA